jgi:hypothetical protein
LKLKENSAIVIYFKLFITGMLFYTAVEIISRTINIIFNRSLATGFSSMGFWGTALASTIISLFALPNYLRTTKAIRMDDKVLFTEMITRVLYKMKWKVEYQEEAEIVFKSSFLFPSWRERITIRFTDTELQIYGPREHIENAIRRANFPYAAFEISNFEK